jgi:hypothetical protein
MIKNGDTENINSLLLDVLGEGYEFETLISVHP